VVLAVDDDHAVLASLGAVLEPGYEVLTAVNATDAVDIVRSEPVDLVLLDIEMPAGDDLELLPQLKALSPRVEVALMVSGLVDMSTLVRAVRLGAADFITKPLEETRLRAVVATAAARRRERSDRAVLVGANTSLLAALKTVLSRHVSATIADPLLPEIAPVGEPPPGFVFFEVPEWSEGDARFVLALRAHCPGAELIVMSSTAAELSWGDGALGPEALIVAPCPFDQVVAHMARVLPGLGAAVMAGGRLNAQIGKAIDHIIRHYREPLPAAEIARAAMLSVHWLSHCFPAAVGMTVKDFVTRLRVEVAVHLLRGSDRKLEEVAELTGFADASHLSRAFKQRLGLRPGEFRRAARDTRSSTTVLPPPPEG
jgi:YesN/AraC family two-component response regulator